MNNWEKYPIDTLQRLAEKFTGSTDPVHVQALAEIATVLKGIEERGEITLGGISPKAESRLQQFNLGPDRKADMPSVPITKDNSQILAQKERLAIQQARVKEEEAAAYKAAHPIRHTAEQAFEGFKKATTPEAAGALGQAVVSLPMIAYENLQALPSGKAGRFALAKTSLPAHLRALKYLGYGTAEGTAYSGFKKLGHMLPWNVDKYPAYENVQGLGEFSRDWWNPFTSGTGAKGDFETGLKFGWLGYGATPVFSEGANVVRRGILGLKARPIKYDPTSPVFLGRRGQPLSDDSQQTVNELWNQYASLGLTDPVGSKWRAGGMYEGVPSIHAATRAGGTTAELYAKAISRIPVVGTPLRQGLTETARRAKETLLNRISLLAGDDWSIFRLGTEMFEAVQTFGRGQLIAIKNNYDAMWSTAAKYAGGRDVVDMVPFRNAISDVLGAQTPVPTTGLPTTVGGVGVRVKGYLPEWKPGSDVSKWLREHVMQIGNARSRLTIPQWKEAHEKIRQAVRDATPDTSDYRILMDVNERFKAFTDDVWSNANSWKGKTPKGLSDNASDTLLSLQGAAKASFKAFKDLIGTPAGQALSKAEKTMFERRSLLPRSGKPFKVPGSIDADALFNAAFHINTPMYINNIRRLINSPKVYNAAVKRRIEDAIQAAFDASTAIGPSSKVMTGRFNPVVFNRMLGIGQGDDLLNTLLKGTGVDPKSVRAFGELLADLPMNNDVATMLARRVALQGMKGVTSFSPLSMLFGAATGGAAAGALGGISAVGMMALILGARRFSTILARPKMMEEFVTAGKSEKAYLAGKTTKALYLSRKLTLMKGIYDVMSDPYREEDYDDPLVYQADEEDRANVLNRLRTFIKTSGELAILGTSLIPTALSPLRMTPEGKPTIGFGYEDRFPLDQAISRYLKGKV